MQVRWMSGDENGPDGFDVYETYEEAATQAKREANGGRTSVVYKAVPCARFTPTITIREDVCES